MKSIKSLLLIAVALLGLAAVSPAKADCVVYRAPCYVAPSRPLSLYSMSPVPQVRYIAPRYVAPSRPLSLYSLSPVPQVRRIIRRR